MDYISTLYIHTSIHHCLVTWWNDQGRSKRWTGWIMYRGHEGPGGPQPQLYHWLGGPSLFLVHGPPYCSLSMGPDSLVHSTEKTEHTTAFDNPVVEHWLERDLDVRSAVNWNTCRVDPWTVKKGSMCTFRASCYSTQLSWVLVLTWVSPFVQEKKSWG